MTTVTPPSFSTMHQIKQSPLLHSSVSSNRDRSASPTKTSTFCTMSNMDYVGHGSSPTRTRNKQFMAAASPNRREIVLGENRQYENIAAPSPRGAQEPETQSPRKESRLLRSLKKQKSATKLSSFFGRKGREFVVDRDTGGDQENSDPFQEVTDGCKDALGIYYPTDRRITVECKPSHGTSCGTLSGSPKRLNRQGRENANEVDKSDSASKGSSGRSAHQSHRRQHDCLPCGTTSAASSDNSIDPPSSRTESNRGSSDLGTSSPSKVMATVAMFNQKSGSSSTNMKLSGYELDMAFETMLVSERTTCCKRLY